MNSRIATAFVAIAYAAGLAASSIHHNMTDDDRTDVQIAREVLEGPDAASLKIMPFVDPCTLLTGKELGADLEIKSVADGETFKDEEFKFSDCTFEDAGVAITLWQEPEFSTAVYRDKRDFGRVFITERAANPADFSGAIEGMLYYDGGKLYEGLFRVGGGITVEITHCNGHFSEKQLKKVAARVLDRLNGV